MERSTGTLQSNKRKKQVWALLFVAPTILLILILNVWPIIQSIWYSFNDVKGLGKPTWVGMANYFQAFHDPALLKALWNTALYTIVTVPVGTILSLVVAVFLNSKIKGKTFFRVIYFIPVVSAPVAVSMVWKWLYNGQYGLINYFLSFFGVKGPDWIGDPKFALWSIMIVGIWSIIGYNMVILLGGLQDIPKTYYEAAEIDGAGPITKFFKVTIPLVSPTLFFVVITTFIGALQVFDYILMMLGTSPALQNSKSIVYLFYQYTFVNNNKGYGASIAIILLVIILILTLIQMKLQKKWVHYK
ncbi:carbohydrate ABC transporter permease [Listeria grayi]|uniref:carbohydrate ABC transporter permease n=1 Tax=Listeria grayi TaxID=1641 RepID=UPI0016275C7B|nr:sugar ABC transporter permease [Listeria grayi]MBC1922562.1 sugar ABC transporter permease [Listeria grayi]